MVVLRYRQPYGNEYPAVNVLELVATCSVNLHSIPDGLTLKRPCYRLSYDQTGNRRRICAESLVLLLVTVLS